MISTLILALLGVYYISKSLFYLKSKELAILSGDTVVSENYSNSIHRIFNDNELGLFVINQVNETRIGLLLALFAFIIDYFKDHIDNIIINDGLFSLVLLFAIPIIPEIIRYLNLFSVQRFINSCLVFYIKHGGSKKNHSMYLEDAKGQLLKFSKNTTKKYLPSLKNITRMIINHYYNKNITILNNSSLPLV